MTNRRKFRIISDLHTEMSNFNFKLDNLPDDKSTVLIVAGDVSNKLSCGKWLNDNYGNRFEHIYYILGNHSYYGTYFHRENDIHSLNYPNVTLLQNNVVNHKGVTITGCTLWTDLKDKTGNHILDDSQSLNDYRLIKRYKACNKPITRDDTIRCFEHDYKWINSLTGIDIMVTHHLPSYKSIHPLYKGYSTNHYYASELDNTIEKLNAKYWIHGHTHTSTDYIIGNTRILCNPVGYNTKYNLQENPQFKQDLIITL